MKMILQITKKLAVFCLLCGCALVCVAQRDITGDYKDVAVTDEQVAAAANFAISSQKETLKTDSLKLLSIENAKRQIVAGTNYSLCLTISVADKTQQVLATVYQNLQQKYQLSSWKREECSEQEPDFKDYPAEVEKINDLDGIFKLDVHNHKNEVRLNGASENGVNFGGHYILTSWYVPADDADQGALIDVRDGKMFFPPELKPGKAPADDNAQYTYCEAPESNRLLYKPDSRLYIIEGLKPSDEYKKDVRCGIYYLEWTGTDFKQIKFIEKPEWTRRQPQ